MLLLDAFTIEEALAACSVLDTSLCKVDCQNCFNLYLNIAMLLSLTYVYIAHLIVDLKSNLLDLRLDLVISNPKKIVGTGYNFSVL